MSWQRRWSPLIAVIVMASACSGGDEQPISEQAAQVTTTVAEQAPTTTTVVVDEATTTTTTTAAPANTAPQSLAFSSSSDLGRLFEVDGSVSPAASVGSEVVGELLSDGTLVQATNLRSRDGQIWVRVRSTDVESTDLGWVTADDLRPTTRSVDRVDPDAVTEFRQVSRVVPDDILAVRAQPGDGSTTTTLVETEVAMHGGNSALLADGVLWVDVVDPNTGASIGWVPASSFAPLTSIEAKALDHTDVDRRADRAITYGAGVSTGNVSAVGCNAHQITFTGASSTQGTALLFGNVPPVGTPLDSTNTRFRWTSSGGSTVYLQPGQTVTFSFPSVGTKNWYFTTLDADGQASFVSSGGGAVLDASGRASATGVQTFEVPAGTCAASEFAEPTLDPYVYDLPDDERDEAIAAFEEELAAFRAAGGQPTESEGEVAGDVTDEGSAEGDSAGEESSEQEVGPAPNPEDVSDFEGATVPAA